MMGSCRYEEECVYIHGDMCELCCQYCLHPTDEAQRQQHNQVELTIRFHFSESENFWHKFSSCHYRIVYCSTKWTWNNHSPLPVPRRRCVAFAWKLSGRRCLLQSNALASFQIALTASASTVFALGGRRNNLKIKLSGIFNANYYYQNYYVF